MHVLDVTYNHLLYNTYGPVSISIKRFSITKIQTNNGMGKTIFLKAILGLIRPSKGLLCNLEKNSYKKRKNIKGDRRLSSSQFKKFKVILAYQNKYIYWILDEPYSYLDLTSIHYFKKKIIEYNFKKCSVIITDCIQRTMLPTLIFYFGTKWI